MAFSSTILTSFLLILIFDGISGAKFTFINKCDYTVWPGILGTPTLDSTGFELPKGGSRSFQAPTGWSGRFWGRTGCTFEESGGGSCATADCGSGGIECGGNSATPPATLAEFTLGSGSQDFYDVSLVDGYNLPVMVDVSGGAGSCEPTGCVDDLNKKCPSELKVAAGGACRSACDAFGTPEYCCKGAYNSAAVCTPSLYSQIFKSACPKSYSYAYDDSSSTFTCINADYTVTFCPSSSSQKSSKDSPKSTDNSGSGSESGSMDEAMLANGAWMANLATGDSTRGHPCGAIQVFAVSITALYYLTLSLMQYLL